MVLPVDYVVENASLEFEDRYIVGIELASLGEFAKNKGLILPRTILTPHAFTHFLDENSLKTQIKHLLGSINHEHHSSLSQVSSYITNLIVNEKLPADISKALFKNIESDKEYFIEAYYFRGHTSLGYFKSQPLKGESVVANEVRVLWANLFSQEYLKKHTIAHDNHHEFSVCLAIVPRLKFELEGIVKTFGAKKGEYEIEARSHVMLTYHKHSKTFVRGHVFPGGKKDALSVFEIKKLLDYAKISEKAFLLPQELYWGKADDKIYVTKITHESSYVEHTNTYDFLTKSMTVTPGITIGRLNVVNEKEGSISISQDEIVLLKSVDKAMIDAIKKARGIIVESDPHPEIVAILKSVGIPTVIRKRERLLYSTGDIITLNATTGEIKRGSMLVS